jgi:ABC-type antimicrobial peptide transport system permease subunit
VTWRDVAVLAARGVRRRPGRAVLTVLAVALATALFSALLTVSRTAEVRVLDELAEGGPLAGITVAAAEPDPNQVDRDDADPGEPRNLDDGALAEMAALPDVEEVLPVVAARVAVIPPDPVTLADGTELSLPDDDGGPAGDGNGMLFETVVGVDLGRAGDLPISVLAGRLPQRGSRVEVVATPTWLARFDLDRTDADRMLGVEIQLGPPRSFGDAVRARWTRAEIVGVVAQEAAEAGALLAPFAAVSEARTWTLAGEDDERFGLASSPYSGAFVVARGLDEVASVRNDIHDIGYATRAPENVIASVQRYLRVVEIVLAGIGLIALAIAAMGIGNALLAAVRERRREIGVLKAIGARDRDVLRLFLTEAGVLGLVGGLVGTLLGLGLAALVGVVVNDFLRGEGLAGIELQIPLGIAAASVAGAGLLALVAGGIPARRAARLPAREAVEA